MSHQVRDPYLPLIHAESYVLYSTDKDTAKDTANSKDMDKGTGKDKDPLVTVVMQEDSLAHRLLPLLPAPTRCAFCSHPSSPPIVGPSPPPVN